LFYNKYKKNGEVGKVVPACLLLLHSGILGKPANINYYEDVVKQRV